MEGEMDSNGLSEEERERDDGGHNNSKVILTQGFVLTDSWML